MADIKTGIVTITGLSDLLRQCDGLPDKIVKNVLAGATRAGAVAIQKEAKQAVPVGGKSHVLGKGSNAVTITPGSNKKEHK